MPAREPSRLCCIATILILLIGLSGTLRASQNDKAQPSFELAAAGNDHMLWIIVGEPDGETGKLVNYFAYRDQSSGRVRPGLLDSAPLGNIERTALVENTLHVFFEGGTHYRYGKATDGRSSRMRCRRERQLPDQAIPAAIAGEPTGRNPLLWAVVDHQTADNVYLQWAESVRKSTTKPSGRNHDESSVVDSSPTVPPLVPALPGTFHLVKYDGITWQPGFAAPTESASARRFWLCATGDRLCLFWQPSQDSSGIRFATSAEKSWTLGQPIGLEQPITEGLAAVMNTQIVFAAMLADPDNPGMLRCRVWDRPGGSPADANWNPLPVLQNDQAELQVPGNSALAAFSDKLTIVRTSQSGPEVGFWVCGTGGQPDQPFEAVPLNKISQEPFSSQGFRDLVATLVVAAMLLLVFWRRQESIASPVALPVGMQVVGPGKRCLAAMIDAAPAAAIVGWIWSAPLTLFYHELQAASEAGERLAQSPQEVIWAWVWFRLIYTAQCTIFELLLSSTPGKRLMGCGILAESLEKPNKVQIVIRNLARLVELEPYLQIWPFILVVFFTRNRQRMGDLLARTIVVERHESFSCDTTDNSDTDEQE